MKKLAPYIILVAMMLLAACSKPANSSTTINIRSASSDVKEYDILDFSADFQGAGNVVWTANNSEVRLVNNRVSEKDPQNTSVRVIVPDAVVGSFTLTATAGDASDTVTLNILDNQPSQQLQFSTGSAVMLTETGASRVLRAHLVNANGKALADNAAITFTSSHPDIISVQADSANQATVRVVGNQVATAIITARAGDLEAHTAVVFAKLEDNVHFIPTNVIQSRITETVTLERTSLTEALQVGSIIVSDGDYGLVDRVAAIQSYPDSLVLSLENVNMGDAFKEVATDIRTPTVNIKTTLVGDGHAVMISESPNGAILTQTVLDNVTCSGANLKLEGSDVTLNTTIHTEVVVQGGSIWSAASAFKFVSNTTTKLDIDSGRLTFSDVSGNETTCTVSFGMTNYEQYPIVNVAPWCIGIKFASSITFKAKGTASNNQLVVDNAFEGSFTNVSRVGFDYKNGAWTKVSEMTSHQKTFKKPVDANFDTDQSFTTSLSASSFHHAYMDVFKGHTTSARLVASYEFFKLNSGANFNANYTKCTTTNPNNPYPTNPNPTNPPMIFITSNPDTERNSTARNSSTGKAGYIGWDISVSHNGELSPTLGTRSIWSRHSLQNFARWELGITAPFGRSTPNHTFSIAADQGSFKAKKCGGGANPIIF